LEAREELFALFLVGFGGYEVASILLGDLEAGAGVLEGHAHEDDASGEFGGATIHAVGGYGHGANV